MRPVKKTNIEKVAGSFGKANEDEIEFATIDPELIPPYYLKKYGGR